MRVISGEKRHLILKTLDGISIRPTTDKIKETLFNIIQFKIQNVNFLDLFAGTGAIGIEALSRGASSATFVDNSREAIEVIKYNLNHIRLIDKSKILYLDAVNAIDVLESNKMIYDILFMDPPYDKKLYVQVFERLSNSKIINEKSLIILETSIKDDVIEIEKVGFKISRVKEYKTNKHLFISK